ncbi:MAG: MmcQ/YjbR family DNA-binding protein [Acidimicrobiia bacterium]|nr:MmcQ/YjbR family DNA-binding protein [Acidimicrobiia bacterium]
MAHQVMYDDDDPDLARVRGIALALPGADVKVSHGRPAFFTKKIFTIYGAAVKEAGEWSQHSQSVLVLLEEDERAAMLTQPQSFVPAYWGPTGWIGIGLDDQTDWVEIAELIESSYRNTAPAKIRASLDRSN